MLFSRAFMRASSAEMASTYFEGSTFEAFGPGALAADVSVGEALS
jgi:hypothetical protein